MLSDHVFLQGGCFLAAALLVSDARHLQPIDRSVSVLRSILFFSRKEKKRILAVHALYSTVCRVVLDVSASTNLIFQVS